MFITSSYHTNCISFKKTELMTRSKSYCFSGIITLYLFFFLHPLLNTFASPTRSLCRHDQRDALLELEKEFSIPPVDSWNKSLDCCSWWGIKCDAILGEVISLELGGYGINTSLKSSSAIFKLQHLRYLDLSDCSLQGEISSYIGNLSQLEYLVLSDNHLVGQLPDSIGNLNQLRYMDLTGNGFKGNIPSSFANFTKLSELVLRGNEFTSGDFVIANLTSLSSIDLSYNLFNSSLPVDLSGLHNLSEFQANDNSFVGPFPSSLLMISSLTWIDLSRNQLEGHLDFGNTSSFSKLKSLNIPVNKLSGLITESISKLHDLISLDLSHNSLEGPIPTSISKIGNLQTLDLSHNSFVGTVPASISKLVNLSYLLLSYNQLEGEVPQFLWRSSSLWNAELSHNSFSSFGEAVQVSDGASLQVLDLGSNSLQGPFPQWVCMLTSLYALVLSNNHFTGPIPSCLKNSTSLRDLNLRNNSLTGTLLDFNSSELRSLDVSRNSLVGKLPRSLVNCPLDLLNVGGNKIKDTFPFWLEFLMVLVLRSNEFYGPVFNPSSAHLRFEYLRVIDISNNNFVGSLPQDYFANFPLMSEVWMGKGEYMLDYLHDYVDSADLVHKGIDMDFVQIRFDFKAVDFSGNRFSGQIPGSVGLMSSVHLLNLSGNAFTGNIPPSLANITTLEALDLSRNNLSGKIPQGLGNLSFLSHINFSHNHLVGLVPQSTQFKTQECSSFLGNPGLYGLEKICGEIKVPVPTLQQQQQPEESLSEAEEPVVNWIAAAIAYGPGVFCGLVIGYIFFSYKHDS